MGGIAGILHVDPTAEPDGARALGSGARFSLPGGAFVAQPRSTLARSDGLVVVVAGHFARVPNTGQSAAEILHDGWVRKGPDILRDIDGAFVAAVLELPSRRLHLLRDAFGVRRLFYSVRNGRVAFASRMRRLLDLPGVSRELARENLAEYLSFRYVHAPRTLLRDVQAVPPGAHVVVDGGQLRTERWAKVAYAPPYAAMPDDRDTLAELERRLNRVVAARASGRERVGAFLSGGLDSTLLTMLAGRLGPVHTFTVGVEDGEDDETPYAGRVANLLGSVHEVVRVDPVSFLGALPTLVATADLPLPDPAAVPQYLLAKAAHERVDVVLCGDGGDELFGGRMVGSLARDLRMSSALQRLPSLARRGLGVALGRRRPELAEPGVPFGLARRIGGTIVFRREERQLLMRDPGWVRAGIRRATLEPFYREVVSDPVNEILHVYLRGRMVEDALLRTGAAAACANVAVRAPLLDRELVAYCARLPGPWKVRTGATGSVTKWPLRELLRPTLGRPLVNRPKRVLPGPWRRWFAGPLRVFLDERLASLRDDPLRLWMPGAVDAIAADPTRPGGDARLWTLILLDLWMRDIGAT